MSGEVISVLSLEGRYYIEDITRRCEDMNFIFEWWKQYFTNERSEWVKYCFHHEKIKFISSNRRVMFFLLYSCKQYKNPVSNIHFWSIMLKISFISTNYIILFELEEYLCIILVFSCSIFIFSGNNMLFFSFNIGSRLLQKSPFWKQNYWREMITWSISSLVKIWKISHCVFSVSYCQLYNKTVYYILVPLSGFKYGKDRNAFRMRFSLGYFWAVMYINNKKLT